MKRFWRRVCFKAAEERHGKTSVWLSRSGGSRAPILVSAAGLDANRNFQGGGGIKGAKGGGIETFRRVS